MNREISATLLVLMLISASAAAQVNARQNSVNISVEVGPLSFARNDVRVPGDSGTEFDMREITGKGLEPFARINADWQVDSRHGIRFVIAPLEVSGTGSLPTETLFAGETFAAGEVNGTYRFSTYQFTYHYTFEPRGNWKWRIGFTGLVRDANIALSQGGVAANDDNVGFAPLLHVGAEYGFSDRWQFILDFDGLAGGPGRAFDVALKASYDIDEKWRIGGGYRLLEGGVDTEEVYNFAWVNYALLEFGYRFGR
jgi:hypothetical protein